MAQANVNVADIGKLKTSSAMKVFYSTCLVLGGIGFALTMMTDSSRAWHAYLIGLFVTCTWAIGGLFFSAIHHSTGAGWSVNIRRFSEGLTAYLPVGLIATLAMLLGGKSLYEWMDSAQVAADEVLQHKSAYLNTNFFIIRVLVFFGIWLWFRQIIVGRSVRQDVEGGQALTLSLVKPSVAFLVLFALTFSFFSVDLLMSLQPHWFSTIFGVYCFAGLFQSTMAVMILLILYVRSQSKLGEFVTSDHLHDLGKYMFAFTVFWAYISFSQYMLIWYANMPEETIFYELRSHGEWMWVSFALMFFRFVVPFVALLPRWAKRTPAHLAAVAILIIFDQFLDIYWIVYPNLGEGHELSFGWQEISIFAMFIGLFLFMVLRFLEQNNLIPLKDPRIHESLGHHVVY